MAAVLLLSLFTLVKMEINPDVWSRRPGFSKLLCRHICFVENHKTVLPHQTTPVFFTSLNHPAHMSEKKTPSSILKTHDSVLSPNTLKMQEKSRPYVHFSTPHTHGHTHTSRKPAGRKRRVMLHLHRSKGVWGGLQGAARIPRPNRPNSWPPVPECGSYLRSVCHNWNSGFLKWARPVALMGGAAAEGEQQE